jgi:hypothetical protein
MANIALNPRRHQLRGFLDAYQPRILPIAIDSTQPSKCPNGDNNQNQ